MLSILDCRYLVIALICRHGVALTVKSVMPALNPQFFVVGESFFLTLQKQIGDPEFMQIALFETASQWTMLLESFVGLGSGEAIYDIPTRSGTGQHQVRILAEGTISGDCTPLCYNSSQILAASSDFNVIDANEIPTSPSSTTAGSTPETTTKVSTPTTTTETVVMPGPGSIAPSPTNSAAMSSTGSLPSTDSTSGAIFSGAPIFSAPVNGTQSETGTSLSASNSNTLLSQIAASTSESVFGVPSTTSSASSIDTSNGAAALEQSSSTHKVLAGSVAGGIIGGLILFGCAGFLLLRAYRYKDQEGPEVDPFLQDGDSEASTGPERMPTPPVEPWRPQPFILSERHPADDMAQPEFRSATAMQPASPLKYPRPSVESSSGLAPLRLSDDTFIAPTPLAASSNALSSDPVPEVPVQLRVPRIVDGNVIEELHTLRQQVRELRTGRVQSTSEWSHSQPPPEYNVD